MATKEFIGHGKKHQQFDIIDVVLSMEKAEGLVYNYEGKRYLKFSVASRREKSSYGATHTVYVRQPEPEVAVAEPAPKKRAAKKAKAA